MPKYLPCSTCRRPALATKDGTKEGFLHTAGQLSSSTVTYLCKRCGRNTTLTAAEFQRLPEMTRAQIASPSCDLTPDQP